MNFSFVGFATTTFRHKHSIDPLSSQPANPILATVVLMVFPVEVDAQSLELVLLPRVLVVLGQQFESLMDLKELLGQI